VNNWLDLVSNKQVLQQVNKQKTMIEKNNKITFVKLYSVIKYLKSYSRVHTRNKIKKTVKYRLYGTESKISNM